MQGLEQVPAPTQVPRDVDGLWNPSGHLKFDEKPEWYVRWIVVTWYYGPMIEYLLAKGLSLSCCSQISLKAIRVYDRDERLDGIQW